MKKLLSQQELEKRKRINKKILTILGIPILILMLFILFTPKDDNKNVTVQSSSKKEIPGLKPVDVYINMEKQGFKTEKNIGSSTEGSLWHNTRTVGNFRYDIYTFSHSTSNVESIKVAVMASPPNDAYECISFYEMIASMPYKGNPVDQTKNWLLENIDKDGASTILGNAKWTVYTKTKWSTVIMIEPV